MKLVRPAWKALVDLHIHDWKDCKNCKFGTSGGQKIFFRGMVPAEVLFIGEAPGDSENSAGEPFVGPSGELLTEIINDLMLYWKFTWCIANTILCTPFDKESKERALCTPTQAELGPCSHRLYEWIQIVQPELIVRVGAVARTIIPDKVNLGTGVTNELGNFVDLNIPTADIVHPAWILHGKKDRVVEKLKVIDKLKVAFSKHLPPF